MRRDASCCCWGWRIRDINALQGALADHLDARAYQRHGGQESGGARGAINPGDVLYQLGTLDPIWITADLYEVDLARVHVGQELEAIATAFPDEIFKGTIARISPNIDPTTHTLPDSMRDAQSRSAR